MIRKSTYTTYVSDCELMSLARFLLPVLREFMADENNQRDFERWRTERKLQLNKLNNEKSL